MLLKVLLRTTTKLIFVRGTLAEKQLLVIIIDNKRDIFVKSTTDQLLANLPNYN
jgi:hypothetical protein